MKLVAIGGTILGTAVGAVAGYFLAKRQLEEKYQTMTQHEIAETKAYLNDLYKKEASGLLDKPTVRKDAARAAVQSLPTAVSDLERIRDKLKYGNIEAVSESKDHPYIINEAEFMENETGYEQMTLTWFSEDETLVDDGEQIFENLDMKVGRENLNKFGEQEDPSCMYVRNDITRIEYEIVLDERSFAEVVAGFVSERAPKNVIPAKRQPRMLGN